MKETYYFLFGSAVTDALEENLDFEEVLKVARREVFAVARFSPKTDNPNQLLSDYDGWEGFCEITEEQFKKFSEL
jgi:20S proteasome alpha/beta subunit